LNFLTCALFMLGEKASSLNFSVLRSYNRSNIFVYDKKGKKYEKKTCFNTKKSGFQVDFTKKRHENAEKSQNHAVMAQNEIGRGG